MHCSLKVICTIVVLAGTISGFAQESVGTAGKKGVDSANDAALPRSRNLRLLEASIGEHDDLGDFTREMIQLVWRPGDPVYLFLILPKKAVKSPVILYLYGFPSDSDRFLNDDFCRFLVRDGVAAAGFVSALTGHRYHDRPMREWFVSQLPEALGDTVEDVLMLLDYLGSRSELDVTRAGMFGQGSGATIAILAAAADPRLKALDLVDPWGDWPDWMAKSTMVPEDERHDFLEPAFLRNAAPYDPVRRLQKLQIPIRLQFLSKTAETPVEARQKIIAAAPSQTKVIPFEVAAARYNAEKLTFFEWIKDQLRAKSTLQHPGKVEPKS